MIFSDGRQLGLNEIDSEYATFVEKFKPKKTTDDCYTPQNVYEAIRDWAVREYNIPSDAEIVRPFYPGGDYERFDYPEGCYVIDNPPFSKLTQICRFYQKHGVRFFLFAPSLTSILDIDGVCAVVAGCEITYENGAQIVTSFETNLENGVKLRTMPELYNIVTAINTANAKNGKKSMPKYEYPPEVITAAMANYCTRHGIDYSVRTSDARYISALDAQKKCGKSIFGGGLLLSPRAAAERAAAERAAAERWELSDREIDIIRRLGKANEEGRENAGISE